MRMRSVSNAYSERRATVQHEACAALEPGDSTNSTEHIVPAELQLCASKEFVARCASHLKKMPETAKHLESAAAKIKVAMDTAVAEPNWTLVNWTMACFQEESEAFKQEWAFDEEIQQLVTAAKSKGSCGKPKKPRSPNAQYRVHALSILFLPIMQFVMLSAALVSLAKDKTFTTKDLCVHYAVYSGDSFFVTGLRVAVEISCDALLYAMAVLQTLLASREWTAVAFIVSLHHRPLANTMVYIAALLELLTSMVCFLHRAHTRSSPIPSALVGVHQALLCARAPV